MNEAAIQQSGNSWFARFGKLEKKIDPKGSVAMPSSLMPLDFEKSHSRPKSNLQAMRSNEHCLLISVSQFWKRYLRIPRSSSMSYKDETSY
ncbi:hypothetical protein ACHAQJ_003431 [Trichoderma viride]